MNEVYRILVVDDDRDSQTADMIQQALLETFPGSLVDVAYDVETATDKIEACAKEADNDYDLGILDIKLPLREGEQEEVSNICKVFGETFREALIVHITAFRETDESVRQHLDHDESHPPGSRKPKMFDKLSPDYFQHLIDYCRMELRGKNIEQQLDRIFKGQARSSRARETGGSFTIALQNLQTDIEVFWQNLPEGAKHKVKLYFEIEESTGKIVGVK